MARNHAIGLDIGTTSVRAAEVSLGATPPRLERYGQVSLPPGAVRDGEVVDVEAVGQAIKQLWSHVRFGGKKVILGVANQRVVVRQVDLLWMPDKELKKSLPMLVQDFVPMPVHEAVLDFVTLAEITGDDQSRLLRGLLVAAAEEMVVHSAESSMRANLVPKVVDLVPFALVRSLGDVSPMGMNVRPEAVIDIGARVTNIVVHENGIPRFVRIVLMGGDMVTDALVDRLAMPVADAEATKRRVGINGMNGIDETDEDLKTARQTMLGPANTLIDEIRGSLDYYLATSGSQPLSRVYLTGGGSLLPGLLQQLTAVVRAPVTPGAVFQRLQLGNTGLSAEQLQIVEPSAAVPIGLALWGAL
ncbi:MAG: type IV pilus assembly protein PilM [Candidatus Nanopelagicales bacterium]